MPALPIARRAGEFVRGILPADRSHWLLLVGATFLLISPSLRWWSEGSLSRPLFMDWRGYCTLLLLPVLAAGSMAYYLAFVGCKKPLRRLLDSVLLPACASLIAVVAVGFYAFQGAVDPQNFAEHSVIETDGWNAHDVLHLAANLGSGFEFAGAGIVLVAVFARLLFGGYTSLPIRLKALSRSPIEDELSLREHRRTMLFVWWMIGLIVLSSFAGRVLAFVTLRYGASSWRMGEIETANDVAFLFFVLLAIGSAGRNAIPTMFRFPTAKYLAIAALIPAAIANVLPLFAYCQARIIWSTHGWGKFMAPEFGAFVVWPHLDSLWLLIGALIEEMAWRGYLQPRFVHRYGLYRGIFLVGVVWGAFHFTWTFGPGMTAGNVIVTIFTRVGSTVAMSYALAWLAIQSRSILPAAIAHAASNAFLMSGHGPLWLNDILWATVGFLLFRFFPLPLASGEDESITQQTPEPEPSGI